MHNPEAEPWAVMQIQHSVNSFIKKWHIQESVKMAAIIVSQRGGGLERIEAIGSAAGLRL
jgi:hypothetical protein